MDVEVDVASFGESNNLARECSIVKFEPFDEIEILGFLHCVPQSGISLVFFDGNDVAGFDEVGRNVHRFAVTVM